MKELDQAIIDSYCRFIQKARNNKASKSKAERQIADAHAIFRIIIEQAQLSMQAITEHTVKREIEFREILGE